MTQNPSEPSGTGFPSEVRWPRQRSDKTDPIVLPFPEGDAGKWRVRKAPWWLAAHITGNVLVLQVQHCGRFSGTVVLEGPDGRTMLPVHSHIYPRTNQAALSTAAGLWFTLIGGFFAAMGLFTSHSLLTDTYAYPVLFPRLMGSLLILVLFSSLGGVFWSAGVVCGPVAGSALGAAGGGLILFGLQLVPFFQLPVHHFPGELELLVSLATALLIITWSACVGGRSLVAWAVTAGTLSGALVIPFKPLAAIPIMPTAPAVALLVVGAGAAGWLAPRQTLSLERAVQENGGARVSTF